MLVVLIRSADPTGPKNSLCAPILSFINPSLEDNSSAVFGETVIFPLMKPVLGRISDVLHFPDGRIISGEYLTTLFDPFPEAVLAFQVRQGPDASIALRVVPNKSFAGLEAALESVRRTLVAKSGASVPVEILEVPHIPSDRGKTHYVISDYRQQVSQDARPRGSRHALETGVAAGLRESRAIPALAAAQL